MVVLIYMEMTMTSISIVYNVMDVKLISAK